MNIHEFATKTTTNTNTGNRPVRAIRSALKDEAFSSAVDQIKAALSDGGVAIEQGQFTLTTADAAHTLKAIYNGMYGPTRKLDDTAAQEIVESWSAEV